MDFASVTEPQVIVSRWSKRSILLTREYSEFDWKRVKSENRRLHRIGTKDCFGFATADTNNLKWTHRCTTRILRVGHGFPNIHDNITYGAVVAAKLEFSGGDYFAQIKMTHHTFVICLTTHAQARGPADAYHETLRSEKRRS